MYLLGLLPNSRTTKDALLALIFFSRLSADNTGSNTER